MTDIDMQPEEVAADLRRKIAEIDELAAEIAALRKRVTPEERRRLDALLRQMVGEDDERR